ncbi:MAG: hypothetical protein COA73_01415 [Candidatus Hydrogenedentota bacterium]|nr:MAG: hypothetical protein COA73_01415 [Candidatus Hydrogenedentota bacterium]
MILSRFLKIDGMAEPENRIVVRWGFALAAIAVMIRFVFWVYTDRLWEDALITVLHSENFANGLGLTHVRYGQERLHGFTSPISVLVPLLADIIHVGWGIHFIRFISALVGGLTVLYAMALSIHPSIRLSPPMAVLFMGYLALEHTQILWGMAGMETQLVTCIILMSVYYAATWKPMALGFSLGLCMLARPDYGFWAIVVGVYVLAKDWRQIFIVVGAAWALYLPWILFTTLYYGSPIPNTVFAKSMGYGMWWKGYDISQIAQHIRASLNGAYFYNSITAPLAPTFPGHGTGFIPYYSWTPWVARFMMAGYGIGLAVLIRRRAWALIPAAGFTLVYGLYYLLLVPIVFGWYMVPFMAVTMLIVVYGLDTLFGMAPKRIGRYLRPAYVSAYVMLIVFTLPKSFAAEKAIQEVVENEVRVKIGEYLGEVMGPEESVALEPLGYVGYYSRKTVWDWPGLCSRAVVEYSESADPAERNMESMMRALQPEYLVLRASGNFAWEIKGDWLDKEYVRIRKFRAPPANMVKIPWIEANLDTAYFLLKRKDLVRPEDIQWHGEPMYPPPGFWEKKNW